METSNKIDVIIIIENQIQGDYIESFFNQETFNITKMYDGNDAYTFLLNNTNLAPIIIMSYQLPGMDGLEIMKRIKEKGKEYAYIFLTADKTVERAIEAMKAGAIDFIPKTNKLQNDLPPMVQKAHGLQQNRINQERIKQELDEKNKELIKLSIVARETNNAVAIFNEECDIEWANEGFTKLLGYSLFEFTEVFGRNILKTPTNENNHNIVNECIQSKNPISYITECLTKNNSTIWIQTTLTPILNEEGSVIKLVTIDTDITEIKQAEQEILRQKQNITNSIIYAERIQKALLPPDDFIQNLLKEYFIFFKPRDIVSGDFYWFKQYGNKLIFAVADCTGHGVPGALMSMLGMSGLNQIVYFETISNNQFKASDILNKLRSFIIQSLHQTGKSGEAVDGMDIVLCIIDFDNNTMQYSGAHNPLIIIRNGQIQTFEADKMPIGIHNRKNQSFTNHEIQIEENDNIYVFSDGYADQFGGTEKRKFMIKNFRLLLQSICHLPMNEQKTILEETMSKWMEEEKQTDDMLIIGIRALLRHKNTIKIQYQLQKQYS